MATTSERLREIISIRNIKQAEIVEKTGINKGSLSCYISGQYLPKQDNIYKLAKCLDVNPAWLMGLDVPMEFPKFDNINVDIGYNTQEISKAMNLYNAYENASPDVRQAVEILLKTAQQIPMVHPTKDTKPAPEVPHLTKDTKQ